MKIIYIANIRIPTEKAHGIQIMKMCEAFVNAGNDVELVVPRRLNNIKENPFEYYGVKENFKIKYLKSPDLIRFAKFGYIFQTLIFTFLANIYLLRNKTDIIYTRDEIIVFLFKFLPKNKLILESHVGKVNFFIKSALNKAGKIITITQGIKDFYLNQFDIDGSKILVSPDGVDLEKFRLDISKTESRNKLNLPLDKKIIMYTGSFFTYDWKGVDILLEASRSFNNEYLFVFVGGNLEDIERINKKGRSKNVLLIGHQPYYTMPYYMKASDILVLPNKRGDKTSEKYTSPMKLFEYMASGNPIVASNLPSIREILNENNSVLVEANSSKTLSNGINNLLGDIYFSGRLSEQALIDVKKYTWQKRAGKILSMII